MFFYPALLSDFFYHSHACSVSFSTLVSLMLCEHSSYILILRFLLYLFWNVLLPDINLAKLTTLSKSHHFNEAYLITIINTKFWPLPKPPLTAPHFPKPDLLTPFTMLDYFNFFHRITFDYFPQLEYKLFRKLWHWSLVCLSIYSSVKHLVDIWNNK